MKAIITITIFIITIITIILVGLVNLWVVFLSPHLGPPRASWK